MEIVSNCYGFLTIILYQLGDYSRPKLKKKHSIFLHRLFYSNFGAFGAKCKIFVNEIGVKIRKKMVQKQMPSDAPVRPIAEYYFRPVLYFGSTLLQLFGRNLPLPIFYFESNFEVFDLLLLNSNFSYDICNSIPIMAFMGI